MDLVRGYHSKKFVYFENDNNGNDSTGLFRSTLRTPDRLKLMFK